MFLINQIIIFSAVEQKINPVVSQNTEKLDVLLLTSAIKVKAIKQTPSPKQNDWIYGLK